jgi:hypothetical protein
MHHARCTCKSCTAVRKTFRFDKLLNDETKILCDTRELIENDEEEEEEKSIRNDEKEEERVLESNTTNAITAACSVTLREMSALLSPIHRELIELRSEVTKLKSDIETLRKNKKEEKVTHEEITKTNRTNKFFPLSMPPITYEPFETSSFSTFSTEFEGGNGEVSLLSEVDRMLSSVRRRCS